jgi:hypothetical protein
LQKFSHKLTSNFYLLLWYLLLSDLNSITQYFQMIFSSVFPREKIFLKTKIFLHFLFVKIWGKSVDKKILGRFVGLGGRERIFGGLLIWDCFLLQICATTMNIYLMFYKPLWVAKMIRKLFDYADVSDLGWIPFQSSTNLFKNH